MKERLECVVCRKDLLEKPGLSMIRIKRNKDGKIESFTPCCKGSCDERLQKHKGEGWEELGHLTNPLTFFSYMMSIIQNYHDGEGFSNEQALLDFKKTMAILYINMFEEKFTERDKQDFEFLKSLEI